MSKRPAEEEDDYLSMTFDEPTPAPIVTRPSKGLKLMKLMGYEEGSGLGKNGILEPIEAVPIDRGGIGLATQKKEEFRAKTDHLEQEVKASEETFLTTKRDEHDEKRIEGQVRAAQRVCETLETRDGEPATVSVVWRGIVRDRRERMRADQLRRQMLDGGRTFSRREYNEDTPNRVIEEEEEEEDTELDEFESLDSVTRLSLLLSHLRSHHFYCFWCGFSYEDKLDLEQNCPGIAEEAHQ